MEILFVTQHQPTPEHEYMVAKVAVTGGKTYYLSFERLGGHIYSAQHENINTQDIVVMLKRETQNRDNTIIDRISCHAGSLLLHELAVLVDLIYLRDAQDSSYSYLGIIKKILERKLQVETQARENAWALSRIEDSEAVRFEEWKTKLEEFNQRVRVKSSSFYCWLTSH